LAASTSGVTCGAAVAGAGPAAAISPDNATTIKSRTIELPRLATMAGSLVAGAT
jgi:hypothetical protein